MINPIDRESLRQQVRSSSPYPHCLIDNFLADDFAERVHNAFPSFEQARSMGHVFRTVNERNKVQITDSSRFDSPVAELNQLLAAPALISTLCAAFEIPGLLADDQLTGGGIHQTGPGGRLDVHVDFNYLEHRKLFRRLNLLLYFNKEWRPEWGGNLELWDDQVKVCKRSFAPLFNRCIIIATTRASYHGVSAVSCPPGSARRSFAAYYYTRESPSDWDGEVHPTIFRGRPDERVKGHLLMPLERGYRRAQKAKQTLKGMVKSRLKRRPPDGRLG